MRDTWTTAAKVAVYIEVTLIPLSTKGVRRSAESEEVGGAPCSTARVTRVLIHAQTADLSTRVFVSVPVLPA